MSGSEAESYSSRSCNEWEQDSDDEESVQDEIDNLQHEEKSLNQCPDGYGLIEEILQRCRPPLTEYLPRFQKAKIMNASIKFVNESTLSEIFKEEIGYRYIVLEQLAKMKKTEIDSNSGEEVCRSNMAELPPNNLGNFISFTKWRKVVRKCYFFQ